MLPTPETLELDEEDEPLRQPARNKVDNNITIIEYFLIRFLKYEIYLKLYSRKIIEKYQNKILYIIEIQA